MGNIKGHLKNAAVTTAMVLVTIYALRKLSFGQTVVDKALNG